MGSCLIVLYTLTLLVMCQLKVKLRTEKIPVSRRRALLHEDTVLATRA